MHHIVMVFALIDMLIAAVIIAFGIAAGTSSSNPLTALPIIGTGAGLLLAGAVLYCTGKMVEELIAIRKATEAQAKIFADRLQKSP